MKDEHGFLMDEPTWAQRVKTVRLKLNVTQEGLGEHLGVDRATIARWEGKIHRPYSAIAEKFVELECELEMEEPS
jgi:transcriptional regulator with XRE-family HTH domain